MYSSADLENHNKKQAPSESQPQECFNNATFENLFDEDEYDSPHPDSSSMMLLSQKLESFSSKILYNSYSKINMAYRIKEVFPRSQLDIEMGSLIFQGFLKKMEGVAFPPLKEVSIYSIPTHNRAVKYFLENSISTSRVTWLSLECARMTDIGFYLNAIIKACHRVKKSIKLNNFQISESQLEKLFMANKRKEGVLFHSCKFTFPKVPDFRRCLEGSSISTISIENCDNSDSSNWRSHPEEFENFIQGLANSDLKKSLQNVDFGWCYGFQEYHISTIFSRYDFEDVQIYGTFMND
ncbi:unnamed protein product [Moneuplotes crassus]|uniref:Uncharacterized protein n=1 Tax=Euplotes crassus TaxID=5936 RepID=A0AAD1U651_EUPCR|nr:unnamed protein product [Moneuplotes crassus]